MVNLSGQTYSQSTTIASLLSERKEAIIKRWEQKVCAQIPAAQYQTESELRDSLPDFIDHLCKALRSKRPRPVSYDDIIDVSENHARQRANLREYDLQQMLAEYRLLREAIFEVLEANLILGSAEREIILFSIEQGMAKAATRYMNAVHKKESILSEEYRIAVESITDHAIIQTDCEGIITKWNLGAEIITGFKKESVIGQNASLLFTPEDLAKHADIQEMKNVRNTGKAESMCWHIRNDGSRFFASGVMNPILDEDNNHVGYVKVFRDQTQELFAKEERERLIEREKELLLKAESARKDLHDFFMQSPTPMMILTGAEHRFLLANPPYEDLVGQKVTGKTILETFNRDEASDLIPMLDNVYNTGRPYIGKELSLYLPRTDGGIDHHWIDVNFFPYWDEMGKVKGILADIHDVTKVVQARKILEKSEKGIWDFLNAIPTMIWSARPDGMVDFYNKFWFEYVGMDPKTDTTTIHWEDYVHPDDLDAVSAAWKKSVVTGEFADHEFRIIRASDQKYRWHNARATPIRDLDGKIIRWAGYTSDIETRKCAEAAIRENKEQYEILANAMPQIVWTADEHGSVFYCNHRYLEYTGLSPNDIDNSAWRKIVHPDDYESSVTLWMEAVKKKSPYIVEYRLKRADGQYRWHLGRALPIRTEDGTSTNWYGTNTDIQDQKNAITRLQEEQALREKFVATLSHDLRTPLTAAKMSADLIERNKSTIPINRKQAHRIVENLSRVDSRIRDLLDVSRIKAGEKLQFKMSECDLAQMTRSTLDDLITIHGDRFVANVPNGLKFISNCDAYMKILENLCNNAVKYGSQEHHVTVTLQDEKEKVILKVHNWGNPIPKEELKMLFEPYKRARTSISTNEKGWGLGLTLVKGITEALNGSVNVQSDEKNGTTFTIVFRRIESHE